MIEGIPTDEFLAANADPIRLHQHEMWELMEEDTGEMMPPSGEPY